MNKKIFVLILLTLLIVPLVNARLATDLTYVNCDNDVNDNWNSNNAAWSGTTTYSNSVPVFNATGDGGLKSCSLDGSSKLVFSTQDVKDISGSITISMWLRKNAALSSNMGYFQRGSWGPAGSIFGRYITDAGGDDYQFQMNGVNDAIRTEFPSSHVGKWIHYIFIYNSTNNKLIHYINGTKSEVSTSGSLVALNNNVDIGEALSSFFVGDVDEIKIYDRAINHTEAINLFNCNDDASCVVPFDYPENIESTSVIKQVGTATLLGPTETIIISQDIEIFNQTNSYTSFSVELESTHDNVAHCRVLVDSIERANFTRSNVANEIGTSFPMTSLINLTQGNHSIELACSKASGPGQIELRNIIGVTHFLIGSFGKIIPSSSKSISGVVSSGESFSKIAEFNVSSGNETEGAGKIQAIIVEGGLTYTNNDIDSKLLKSYIKINDTFNCSITPRTVAGLGSGNVGLDCILENVSESKNYKIEVYANGDNAEYEGNLVAKTFYIHNEEIAGGIGSLTGLSFNGGSAVKIFNLTGGNQFHANANVLQKISLSINTTDNTRVDMYVKLINGENFTTKNFTREFSAGVVGNLVSQDILTNVSKDDYDIEVWANCGGSNCTIVGGSSHGYLTDVVEEIPNSFNVFVHNFWSGERIYDFYAFNGVKFTTVDGLIQYFTNESLHTFTVGANGYFNKTFTNYNTSNDLNTTLFKSIINVSIVERFSGTPINNWELFNGTRLLINTSSNSGLFYPNSGVFNDLILRSKTGAFSDRNLDSFNVSVFDNKTVIYELLPTDFNVTAINLATGATINNFSITYVNLNRTHSSTLSTTNGVIGFGVVDGDVYNISIDAFGFATYDSSVLKKISGSGNHEFQLYVTNTINVTFIDENTGNIITDPIYANFIGDIVSYNYTTSNGSIYEELLNPQRYTIQYGSVDGSYSQRLYYLTLTNRSYNELTLYLNSDNFTSITATVYDQSSVELEGAVIRVLRFDPLTNSFVLSQMGETNFEGVTQLDLVKFTTFYKFQIYYPDNNLRFTSSKTYVYDDNIKFYISVDDRFAQNYYTDTNIQGYLSFLDSSNNFKFEYTNPYGNSESVCLKVYESKTLGNVLINYSCLTSATGIIYVPISIVNGTTYIAKATIELDSKERVIDSLSKSFKDDLPAKKYWLFIMVLVTIMFLFIDVYMVKNAIILTPLPIVIACAVGVIPISIYVGVTLWIAMFVLSVVVRR